MYFLLVVVVMVVGIFLFYWLVIKYAETIVTLLVERKHRDVMPLSNFAVQALHGIFNAIHNLRPPLKTIGFR